MRSDAAEELAKGRAERGRRQVVAGARPLPGFHEGRTRTFDGPDRSTQPPSVMTFVASEKDVKNDERGEDPCQREDARNELERGWTLADENGEGVGGCKFAA